AIIGAFQEPAARRSARAQPLVLVINRVAVGWIDPREPAIGTAKGAPGHRVAELHHPVVLGSAVNDVGVGGVRSDARELRDAQPWSAEIVEARPLDRAGIGI